ncbi:hypothetical protein COW46_03020 [Candidatus Gracilibacteria bacterium CG17_big_fil_post_rev_8_21_14_2_50_48_13]|nr:MAG: hypothetical protein COW46_03020 [Candidatus Gracilibacteria bacterium CG17_big_fil_post_rev_8_21_14_2_50_48_13]
MGAPKKTHAKEYLSELSVKKGGLPWLVDLIDTVIKTNGILSDTEKDRLYGKILSENKINTGDATGVESDQESPVAVPASFQEATTTGLQLKRLEKITHKQGVNALLADQELSFHPECTLVFGLNGSGKSGYFRIIHELAGGESAKEIIGNVYGASEQKFEVLVDYIGHDDSAKNYNWTDKGLRGVQPFAGIKVFDSEYLPVFLSERENVVDLEPLGLHLFYLIIAVLEDFKGRLTVLRDSTVAKKPNIDNIIEEINAIDLKVLLRKSALTQTEQAQLDAHSTFTDADKDKLKGEEKKKTDLEKSNPEDRKKILNAEKTKLQSLKTFLATADKNLRENHPKTKAAISDFLTKKATADDRLKQFEALKSLPAKDSTEWKDFLDSSEKYQEKIDVREFNYTKKCLYCHQDLDTDALTLVQSYGAHLGDQSQKQLKDAEIALSVVQVALKGVATDFTFDDELNVLLESVSVASNTLKVATTEILVSLENAKQTLLSCIADKKKITDDYQIDSSSITTAIDAFIKAKDDALTALSDDKARLEALNKAIAEIQSLKDKEVLTRWKADIQKHYQFNDLITKVDIATRQLDTTAFSKMCGEASEELLTDSFRNAFKDELEKLNKNIGTDNIQIPKAKVVKGSIRTKKEIRGRSLKEILSEGEQKAVALSLFFAEISGDLTKMPVVFDDPVNSLDHEVGESLALRIAQLSKERQVVVFTHDLWFARKIVAACEKESVKLAPHWVQKTTAGSGQIDLNSTPKMANIGVLQGKYDASVSDFESKDNQEKERALSAALDYLRSACECLIEDVLFAGTVQRYDHHIRVQNLASAVLDADLAEKIVELHGQISEKGMMHNRSDFEEQNPTTIDDFKGLKKTFEDLHAEIKKRQSENNKKREEKRKQDKADPIKNL